MGRGLSPLQTTILMLALAGREKHQDPSSFGADVYYSDIMVVFYGWTKQDTWHTGPGSQKFSRQTIGGKRYAAAQAAVSRAVQRLNDRGLVQAVQGLNWSGANLTDAGIRATTKLSVNRVA